MYKNTLGLRRDNMTMRNQQRRPVIGGVVHGGAPDTTRQGRKRRAKQDVTEMAKLARKKLKLPTGKEVQEVGRTKEK